MNVVYLVVLTAVSALADAVGFINVDKGWVGNRPHYSAIVLACTGYAVGIATYVFAVKYLKLLTDVGPEIQTVGWFMLTIIGVALGSGAFFSWPLPTKFLATVTVLALVVIAIRTGG